MNRQKAIALEYGTHPAPIVTARGEGEVAEQIIREATRQGIWVAENPQLLALLSRIQLDQEIPPDLYQAVAVILSWIYWLKGMQPGDERRASAG